MSTLGLTAMTALLAVPAGAALLLVGLSNYRRGARLNVGAALISLLASITLFWMRPDANVYLRVDDFNIYLIVLNNLVSFTTSVFSAGYIAHELETGRLTPKYLRFYHAMYQALVFAMNLAFLANNIGLLWVAIELATLVTVLMVGIYRTRAALEAAWKYFILGSLGIALALFGTILVYLAAQPVIGQGLPAMAWDQLLTHAHAFDPALLNLAFIFLLLGYGTKAGLVPLHAWLPDAHAEGPTPISAVLSGLLLNVALYAVLRFKMLMSAQSAGAWRRDP
jgi:hydrogenase-4 component F